ncbi:MAG TPA: hypothetical protein VHQ69_04890 [Methylomirabilota bacterium]|nr:hypothetical protein [Methylomirabilota bacterium]
MELRRDDLVRAAGDRAQGRADGLATVQEEIRRAQAEALGRTGERLQGILDRLAALDRWLDNLSDQPLEAAGALVRVETETRNRLRDEAVRVRHQLIIQREALGFARQTPVEQCYPVPARRFVPAPCDAEGGSHD